MNDGLLEKAIAHASLIAQIANKIHAELNDYHPAKEDGRAIASMAEIVFDALISEDSETLYIQRLRRNSDPNSTPTA